METARGLVRRMRRWRREKTRLAAFRRELAGRGVRCADATRFYGINGISLGRGCRIDAGVVIAVDTPALWADLLDAPRGRVVIGDRCDILAGVIIAAYGGLVELGDDVSLNPYVVVLGGGRVRIGSKTRIAPHTVIVAANHNFADPHTPIMEQGLTCQGIEVGRDVWIGAGAKILDGVRVGDGAVVGAGAVVTQTVENYAIVVGVPARKVGSRDERHDVLPKVQGAARDAVSPPRRA